MHSPLIPPAALRRRMLIVAALITLALPVAVAIAAQKRASGMRVFTGNNTHFLVFQSARCTIKGHRFEAYTRLERGWYMQIAIRPFTGFHRYALVRGRFNGTYMALVPPGSAGEYASDFVPPYHIPSGGQINFSDHGSVMGGGFYPMFNESGSDAVGVAGALTCHYPKRKR